MERAVRNFHFLSILIVTSSWSLELQILRCVKIDYKHSHSRADDSFLGYISLYPRRSTPTFQRCFSIRPDDGSITYLQNFVLLQDYTAQYPRRQAIFIITAVRTWSLTLTTLRILEIPTSKLVPDICYPYSKFSLFFLYLNCIPVTNNRQ
jgi:hypothetical protein